MSETVRALRLSADVKGVVFGPVAADRVLAGSPLQAAVNQFSNSRGNFHCGVWASGPGTWRINYTEDEFCVLLEGAALLTDASGTEFRAQSGDAFVIPAGFEGTWESVGEVRKYYAIYEEP